MNRIARVVSASLPVRVGFLTAPRAVKFGLGAAVHRKGKSTLRALLAGVSRLHRAIANSALLQLDFEFLRTEPS